MDNLIDRAKFNISQFRGSEDGQLPDDLYVTNMLKRSGKNVSDMDRQMIMKMLSEGMPKEMVIKNMLQEGGRNISSMDRAMVSGLGSIANSKNNMPYRDREMINKMAGGGEASFPDLNKDGEITQADILMGRGVYAEGDEVMDVNNIPEDIKQKVENIYRKLYLADPDTERNRRGPATASLTDEENQLLDQYIKGKLRRDVPLLSKYMDMIGMDDIVNDNPFLQGLKVASTSLGMVGAMPTSKIRGAMNPELGIGNNPILSKIMEERKETYGYANGGEAIGDELAGMEMSEEDAMEVNDMDSNDMQMIEQLMMVVQQLISQGVGEQEIRMFLKEQGLDDEDIETLFEMLGDSAMQQQQDQGIDQQLQGMM